MGRVNVCECAGLCRLWASEFGWLGENVKAAARASQALDRTVRIQSFDMGLEAGLKNACYRYHMHAKPSAETEQWRCCRWPIIVRCSHGAMLCTLGNKRLTCLDKTSCALYWRLTCIDWHSGHRLWKSRLHCPRRSKEPTNEACLS